MRRPSKGILLICFVLVLCASFVFAEEITITTYYPSPYGSYNELTTKSNTYLATTSGRVGIGTTVPGSKLSVSGGVSVGQNYGVAAPSNGMIIEGKVGIGTADPFWNSKLEVNGGSGGIPAIIMSYADYFGVRDPWGSVRSLLTGRWTNDATYLSGGTGGLYLRTNNSAIDAMYINVSGLIGMGRNPTTYKLEVEGDASKTTAGSWQANSDQRIKKDISSISDAVSTLNLVRPVKFKYTDEYKAQHPSIQDKYYYNFIAQEFQKVFPTEVTVTNDTLPNGEHILAIDPYVLTPYLVKAVQEQQKEIESLKSEIEKIKAKSSK